MSGIPDDDYLDVLRRRIDADAELLNARITSLVELLVEREGTWSEVIRLVIGVGACRGHEVAQALSVQRDTVTRWFKCETSPQPQQVPVYAARLLDHLRNRRPIARTIDPRTLVAA